MAHIRVLRHYIHTPFLVTAIVEALVVVVSAYTGYFTRFGQFPLLFEHLPFALTFSLVVVFCIISMGAYEARLREGLLGVLLRTAVAVFLLGTFIMAVVIFFVPSLAQARGVLVFSSIEAFVLIAFVRWGSSNLLGEDFLKVKILLLGSGNRAIKVASRMRRQSDRRAFILHGFLQQANTLDLVSEFGMRVLPYPTDTTLLEYCQAQGIDEIVVATDDRRADTSGTPTPFEDLLECRLSGIDVCEVQNFIEREASKIDVDLLQRSWLVYSDGFVTNFYQAVIKRLFDLVVASALVLVFMPVWVLTALVVGVGSRFKKPILYWQDRVGKNGAVIRVPKFRTMRVDAEESGAVWADHDDPRTTRIGRLLRKTHMDELPQLFSVIKGDMSMVGPRPERPVFVEHLSQQIPFYAQRHRMKPGLTGWAQLCFPYGASVEDSKEKLQYDLYYLKNHSIFLDVIILVQTIELVLVGEGSR